jgi:hypothetical protein
MNRHFSYMTEIHRGAKRPCDAMALRQELARAHRAEEIF